METWKAVEGTGGKYEVSNVGRVRNTQTNRVLSQHDNGKGYSKVHIEVDGEHKKCYVHRLVADAFLDNPHTKREVNHKDSNPANNNVENLEWVTPSENIKHAVYKRRLNAWGNEARPIISHCVETGEEMRFATISEAERHFGSRHITDVLKGKRKKVKGHTFRYVEGGGLNVAFSYARA